MGLETGDYINDLTITNPTGADPKSQGDDHLRLIKKALKQSIMGFTGAVLATGTEAVGATTNDYVVTISPAPLAYVDRMIVAFRATHANTGAATVKVNSLAAVSLISNTGTALSSGSISNGSEVMAIYDGTNFRVLSGNFTVTSALPSQTGNAGKFLQTNGTVESWANVDLNRKTRTSDTAITTTDRYDLIDITSGTFTQTFVAAATLGDGWYCYIRNSGTGDITLDPNGAETIDGLASFIMYPGEARLVVCNGTSLFSIVLSPFKKDFTASGTFTKPSGYSDFGGLLWAAGGSGAKASANMGGGGGGGACVPFSIPSSKFGTTETITIGAGGAAVAVNGNGNTGGNSTMGSLLTSYGGVGGELDAATGRGGGGGGVRSAGGAIPTGGAPNNEDSSDLNVFGGGPGSSSGSAGSSSFYGGGGGGAATAGTSSAGGNSTYGGAGGGGSKSGSTAAGGTSVIGGNGGAGNDVSDGVAGSQPGGGGGAANSGSSGAGGAGQLTIWGLV